MKTKTKKDVEKKLSKKLFTLISEVQVISDGEREFWLASYQELPTVAQNDLFDILKIAEKEFEKEQDAHLAKIAEIDAKCLNKLHSLAKQNGKKVDARHEEEIDEDLNFDEEEIFRELRAVGEI